MTERNECVFLCVYTFLRLPFGSYLALQLSACENSTLTMAFELNANTKKTTENNTRIEFESIFVSLKKRHAFLPRKTKEEWNLLRKYNLISFTLLLCSSRFATKSIAFLLFISTFWLFADFIECVTEYSIELTWLSTVVCITSAPLTTEPNTIFGQ